MKYIILCTTLMISILFAQSSYTNTNNGKIDMHGGKSDKLTSNSGSFSNHSFTLGGMSLQKDIKKTSSAPIKKKILKIEKWYIIFELKSDLI